MATYINGATDYIPQVQRFQPKLNFYANALGTLQSKYDAGYNQLNSVYSSILNAPLSRESNQGRRDDFLKSLSSQLQKIAGTDLSKPQNVDKAYQVFQPFYEDKHILNDIAKTKTFQKEMNHASYLRDCLDEKCEGKFWEGGVQYLQMKHQEFVEAGDDQALGMSSAHYVENFNMMEDAAERVKELGWEIKTKGPEGGYMVTRKNGEQAIVPLSTLLGQLYSNDSKALDYYKAKGYLLRKNTEMSGQNPLSLFEQINQTQELATEQSGRNEFDTKELELKEKTLKEKLRLNQGDSESATELKSVQQQQELLAGERKTFKRIGRDIEAMEQRSEFVKPEAFDANLANSLMMQDIYGAASTIAMNTASVEVNGADPYALAKYKSQLRIQEALITAEANSVANIGNVTDSNQVKYDKKNKKYHVAVGQDVKIVPKGIMDSFVKKIDKEIIEGNIEQSEAYDENGNIKFTTNATGDVVPEALVKEVNLDTPETASKIKIKTASGYDTSDMSDEAGAAAENYKGIEEGGKEIQGIYDFHAGNDEAAIRSLSKKESDEKLKLYQNIVNKGGVLTPEEEGEYRNLYKQYTVESTGTGKQEAYDQYRNNFSNNVWGMLSSTMDTSASVLQEDGTWKEESNVSMAKTDLTKDLNYENNYEPAYSEEGFAKFIKGEVDSNEFDIDKFYEVYKRKNPLKLNTDETLLNISKLDAKKRALAAKYKRRADQMNSTLNETLESEYYSAGKSLYSHDIDRDRGGQEHYINKSYIALKGKEAFNENGTSYWRNRSSATYNNDILNKIDQDLSTEEGISKVLNELGVDQNGYQKKTVVIERSKDGIPMAYGIESTGSNLFTTTTFENEWGDFYEEGIADDRTKKITMSIAQKLIKNADPEVKEKVMDQINSGYVPEFIERIIETGDGLLNESIEVLDKNLEFTFDETASRSPVQKGEINMATEYGSSNVTRQYLGTVFDDADGKNVKITQGSREMYNNIRELLADGLSYKSKSKLKYSLDVSADNTDNFNMKVSIPEDLGAEMGWYNKTKNTWLPGYMNGVLFFSYKNASNVNLFQKYATQDPGFENIQNGESLVLPMPSGHNIMFEPKERQNEYEYSYYDLYPKGKLPFKGGEYDLGTGLVSFTNGNTARIPMLPEKVDKTTDMTSFYDNYYSVISQILSLSEELAMDPSKIDQLQ